MFLFTEFHSILISSLRKIHDPHAKYEWMYFNILHIILSAMSFVCSFHLNHADTTGNFRVPISCNFRVYFRPVKFRFRSWAQHSLEFLTLGSLWPQLPLRSLLRPASPTTCPATPSTPASLTYSLFTATKGRHFLSRSMPRTWVNIWA